MAQGTCEGSTKVRKIPLLTRVNAEEGTQTVRILLARGPAGVKERTRHTMQRWLDMVDRRAARVGSKPDQKRQGIEWYFLERGTGQVRSNHPARTWVEGQEKQAASGTQAKGTLDVKECSEILEQMIRTERRMESIDQEERQKAVATINPGRHLSVATKSILRLVRMVSRND
jgi:hypothetical protein